MKKQILRITAVLLAMIIMAPAYMPTVKAAGTTYYVSATGTSSSGTGPSAPMSLSTANSKTLSGGDTLLFKRGDIFYGVFTPKAISGASASNRATVSSYGDGALPVLTTAKIVSSAWEASSDGFYRFNLGNSGNYTGYKSNTCNIGFMEDANGVKWGIRRADAAACTGDYDFYCTDTSGNRYIYCKSPVDPYTALGTLIMNENASLVTLRSNMDVSELNLKDSGYGFVQHYNSGNYNQQNISITDCVIENLGGNRLGTSGFVKAGNGIEFLNSASNILIERNIIRNCYDTGFTLQGNDSIWTNVTVKNNILTNNTQAFEFWTGPEPTAAPGTGVNGCNIIDNICINQGEGWGTAARPDRIGGGGQVCSTDLLAYGYFAPVCNITITGNAFYNRNKENRIYSVPSTGIDVFKKSTIDNNMIYFPKKNNVIASTDLMNYIDGNIQLTFALWQNKYGHDINGTFTAIDGQSAKYAKMESKALTSRSFVKIYNEVTAAGIGISIDIPLNYNDPEAPDQEAPPVYENILTSINPATDLQHVVIAHPMDWTAAVPFTYNPVNFSFGPAVPSWVSGYFDGEFADTNGGMGLDLAYMAIGGGGNSGAHLTYRSGLLLNLGKARDVNELKIYPMTGGWGGNVLGFSVYGGNQPDSTLLSNCIGFGGGTGTQSAELSSAEEIQYVLIMFDKLDTDNWCTNPDHYTWVGTHDEHCTVATGAQRFAGVSDGGIRLQEIELYAAAEEEAAVNTENILTSINMDTNLYKVLIEHDLDWSETVPLPYNPSHFGYGQSGNYNIYQGFKDGFFDGKFADADNGNPGMGMELADGMHLDYRVGLLIDLEKARDVNELKIYPMTGGWGGNVLGFSVYGGNTMDNTILSNCIGFGGGTGVQAAELTSAVKVRYIVIMFDKLDTDCWCTNHAHYAWNSGHDENCTVAAGAQKGAGWSDGGLRIKEIELYAAVEEAAVNTENILPSIDMDTNLYKVLIEHDLDWTENVPLPYDPNNFGYGMTGFYNVKQDFKNGFFDGKFADVSDGDGMGMSIEGMPGFPDSSAHLKYRVGLLFNLEKARDVNELKIYPATELWGGGNVLGFSVYGGNVLDNTIMNNCIGFGGGTGVQTVSLTSDAKVKYILIMFDRVEHDSWCTNPDHYVWNGAHNVNCTVAEGAQRGGDWSDGGLRLKEIELYTAVEEEEYDIADLVNVLPLLDASSDIYRTRVKHTLDWTQTVPLPYNPEGFADGDIFSPDPNGIGVFFDGLRENHVGAMDNGNHALHLTHRMGILFDLGSPRDVKEMKLFPVTNNYWGGNVLGFSVYGSNTVGISILNNCIGSGGGIGVQAAELNSAYKVQYVLIVFDKLDTDSWCTDRHAAWGVHDENCVVAPGAQKNDFPYSDGGVRLQEIELYAEPLAEEVGLVLKESSEYKIETVNDVRYLRDVLPGASASDIVNEFKTSKFVSVSQGTVATGSAITFNYGGRTDTLTLALKGDADGTGEVNALDLVAIKKHILGIDLPLDGAFAVAADTDGDGVALTDLVTIKRMIVSQTVID